MMNLDPLASQLAARGVAYAPEIAGAAAQHGLDPYLLAAVAAQESGGPGANGGRNVLGDGGHGHGLFQIDDRWHDFAREPAAMVPARNADYAAGMIQGLLRRFHGHVRRALSAYNAGSPDATGTRTRWGDGADLGYADSVLRHYRQLAGTGPPTAPTSSPLDNAIAELPGDLASSGALCAQARGLPQLPQPAYQRPVVDYGTLLDDSASANP